MHSFAKKAPHGNSLLSNNDLKAFLLNARQLSSTEEALRVFETGNFKDYGLLGQSPIPGSWSPKYFGGAVEFLSETFFEHFGAAFNIGSVSSTDDYDSAEMDGGVDHTAKSLRKQLFKNGIECSPQSPVFIQTKGTMNVKKVFKTNDGSRLPNFFMNAFSQARKNGCAYQARYVLFTTGKSIHHTLDNNSGNVCEVINYNKICSFVDGNVDFWNKMRSKMGVDLQGDPNHSPKDTDYLLIQDKINQLSS